MPRAFATDGVKVTGQSGCLKGTWEKHFPALAGWLCDAAYDDGKPCGPVQLSLKRRGSDVVITLKLADQGGLKLEAVESSPDKALVALEALLKADPVPWQADAYPLSGGPKKKK